jgi:hypothetical protein
MGTNTLVTNTTGCWNVGIGAFALEANTASANTGIGSDALANISTGSCNTAIGRQAGLVITAGTANQTSAKSVYVGFDTRASANGNTNEIVIGAESRGCGSNTVRLGNTSITQVYTSGCMNAPAYFETSDINAKNVVETNPQIDVDLDVIKYVLKTDKEGKVRYGYSAQEAQKILPELVQKDNDGNLYLSYKDVHTLKISSIERKIKNLEKSFLQLSKFGTFEDKKETLKTLFLELNPELDTSICDSLSYNELLSLIVKSISDMKNNSDKKSTPN